MHNASEASSLPILLRPNSNGVQRFELSMRQVIRQGSLTHSLHIMSRHSSMQPRRFSIRTDVAWYVLILVTILRIPPM